MKRTKAIELLGAAGISHEVREFSAREFTAEEAARELGMAPETVFKTLVARGERSGVVMAVVPGSASLSLRKLAAVAGDKRMEMVDVSELQRLTGYLKGGVSPLGGRRAYPVFLDSAAERCERIAVSAGLRGVQVVLAPADLARAASATLADIAE